MTTGSMTPNDLYAKARERVEEIRGFYIHLAIYLLVNAALFIIDVFTGEGWFFMWVLFGWGIGVAAHAVTLFFSGSRFAAEWEERKIESYVREMEANADHQERVSPR